MKQVWIPRTGGPDVLDVREAPDPTPGPGQVLVAVEAAGVNFADLLARQGLYPDSPPLPAVVGYEVAGRVAAVGAGVAGWAAGDAVVALTRFGGYSTHVVVPASGVFARPAGLSAEAAAAIPVNYLTVFQALVVMGGLRAADELGGRPVRVLVHSAAGGVGTAAADVGRLYGAELFGTASPGKHAYCRERGYTHLFGYDGWVAGVRRATGGRGVDVVLDPVGGASWGRSLDVLAPTGRLVVYGFSAAAGRGKLGMLREAAGVPWLRFNPLALMNANRGVLGVNLGHLWDVADDVARWARVLLAHAEQGNIRPHVDRTFPFAEAADAHRYIEERRSVGKVLLVP